MDIPPPSHPQVVALRYFELASFLSYVFTAFLILPWTDHRLHGWCGTGSMMQAQMSIFFGGISGFFALLAPPTVSDPSQKAKIVIRFLLSGAVAVFLPLIVTGIGEMLVQK